MRTYAAAYSYQKRTDTSNSYFQGSRKGQVGQLRVMLKNNLDGRNEQFRKDIIKKIIAYTTLGVDTSRLFPEMVMASNTNDVDEKKLIYFYLSIYAEEYSDVAIMAINTFMKDCHSQDYRVRGLSLKSLCGLKFKGAEQYILPILRTALDDASAYVRRAAVMGVAKVYYMMPEIRNDLALMDKLYAMIRDTDGTVVVDAIVTLNQVLQQDGGIVLTEKLVMYLLNHLNNFNEWQQSIVLELLCKYQPSQEDMFKILDLLDTKLRQSSCSLVLSSIKLFLKYAKQKPSLHSHILQRIRQPLLTLLTSAEVDTHQTIYVVLEHILYIISSIGGKDYFEKFYKHFFCKVDEPTYLKVAKINILKYLAAESNMSDIFNELEEYASEDEIVSRTAVGALGQIALRVPVEYCRLIIKILNKKVQLEREHICNETVLVFQQLLRKFPKQFNLISVELNTLVQQVTDNTSKCSLLLILGQFGEHIDYAPQYLQQFTYDNFTHLPCELKQAVLKSSIYLFLKRPQEMLAILSRVFDRIINAESPQIQLKDLAALYYRAMQTSMASFKELYLTRRDFISVAEEILPEFQFNTLEIIYREDKEKFTRDVRSFGRMYALEFQPQMLNPTATTEDIIIDVDPKYKILDADDFQLDFEIDAQEFEKLWTELPEGACITRMLQNIEDVTESNLQQLFKVWRIYLMATGMQDNIIKMYFYCKTTKIACMELQANLQAETITIMTKCQNEQLAGFVSKYMQQSLKTNDFI